MIPGKVIESHVGWAAGLRERLPPGAHIILLGAFAQSCAEGRREGLVLRDTVLVLNRREEPCLAALFRVPLEVPVIDQVLATGTGALDIDGCRVGLIGGTKRSEQTPYAKREDGREDRSKSWARTGHAVLSVDTGRWPPNVLPTFDMQQVMFPYVKSPEDALHWLHRLVTGSGRFEDFRTHTARKPVEVAVPVHIPDVGNTAEHLAELEEFNATLK